MTQTPSSENTAVVATYPARHYALESAGLLPDSIMEDPEEDEAEEL